MQPRSALSRTTVRHCNKYVKCLELWLKPYA